MERRFRGELKFEMTFVRRTEFSLILKHPSGPNLKRHSNYISGLEITFK